MERRPASEVALSRIVNKEEDEFTKKAKEDEKERKRLKRLEPRALEPKRPRDDRDHYHERILKFQKHRERVMEIAAENVAAAATKEKEASL